MLVRAPLAAIIATCCFIVDGDAQGKAPIYVRLGGVLNDYILITSDIERITIKDVIVNQGKCELYFEKLPGTVNFNQTSKFEARNSRTDGRQLSEDSPTGVCNINEVKITTDQGVWTFIWK